VRAPAPVEPAREPESRPAAEPEPPAQARRDPADATTRPRRNEPRAEARDEDLPGNRTEDEPEDREAPIGPKLIQWNGYVRGEREVTIELPGVPGTIEIPRVYRDRVGVIEPPTAGNRWQSATVRVYGRGHVSFVMRWWPMTGNHGRFSASK
jgi:hypothetical protein